MIEKCLNCKYWKDINKTQECYNHFNLTDWEIKKIGQCNIDNFLCTEDYDCQKYKTKIL